MIPLKQLEIINMAKGAYDTLNLALEAENMSHMSSSDVHFHIGSMVYNQTVRFNFEGRHVVIYRRDSGHYEILSYKC